MSITMRIMQKFDPTREKEFMELEKKFAELETARPDYPKGTRMQPISAAEPVNTLIWQCEFPDIESAYKVLDFFKGDKAHEALFEKQLPYFKQVKIEFYKNLDY
ncbi:MAG: hypothetical protein KAR20_22535 [Candidatus Heimdallarchaeota archaeon]|nr:hypothetical protein [Candidatus Heimdallarchaeota archaeon]